jgi:hypothetical protein
MLRDFLERARVSIAVRFRWHSRPAVAEAIRGFSATEADGVWHLQRGMARLSDDRQRAVMLTHCLEEECHAEAFAVTYGAYADRPLAPAAYERGDLYPPDAPAWKTFAFVHVGEEEATSRFRHLARALEDGPLKRVLGEVVQDEEGHVDLTRRMLVRLGATDAEVSRELARVRLVRAWEAWLRTGRQLVDRLATALLSVVYFALGPLVTRAARRRLAEPLVAYDNNAVKSLLG